MKKFQFQNHCNHLRINSTKVIKTSIYNLNLSNLDKRYQSKEINFQRNPKCFPKINAKEKNISQKNFHDIQK